MIIYEALKSAMFIKCHTILLQSVHFVIGNVSSDTPPATGMYQKQHGGAILQQSLDNSTYDHKQQQEILIRFLRFLQVCASVESESMESEPCRTPQTICDVCLGYQYADGLSL